VVQIKVFLFFLIVHIDFYEAKCIFKKLGKSLYNFGMLNGFVKKKKDSMKLENMLILTSTEKLKK